MSDEPIQVLAPYPALKTLAAMLSGYGVLRQASGVERLAKCGVFAISQSNGGKSAVIHFNAR
ncbi:MAG: hypothetical protein ACJAUE_001234 [Alcanivorax sp.]